jgi:hypothetical protein
MRLGKKGRCETYELTEGREEVGLGVKKDDLVGVS